jgi:hypothetical protein
MGEAMLTRKQRHKVHSEILSLISALASNDDCRVIRFVATQVGRQTAEEAEFCKHDVRGRG